MDRHVLRYGNTESAVTAIWIKIFLLQIVKDNNGLKIILEMVVFCSSVWFGPSNTFPFAGSAGDPPSALLATGRTWLWDLSILVPNTSKTSGHPAFRSWQCLRSPDDCDISLCPLLFCLSKAQWTMVSALYEIPVVCGFWLHPGLGSSWGKLKMSLHSLSCLCIEWKMNLV